MTHIRQILISCITALLALCMAACGDRQLQERFDTVERITTDHPDSALTLLAAVPDPSRLATADRARYDLLMAEARYMADSIDTVPTRLLEVAEYFDRKGDSHNAARAYYYAGIQTRQKGDHGQAIISFLKAEKRVDGNKQYLFSAKVSRAIADSYAEFKDWQSALYYHIKSYKSFRKANIFKYYENSLYDVSCCYFATRQYDSCIYYSKELYEHAQINGDSINMQPYAISLLGRAYLEKGMYREAADKFKELQRDHAEYMDAEDYMHYGMALLRNGDIDNAQIANQQALALDSGMVELDFYIANATGKAGRASDLLGLITSIQANEIDSLVGRKYNVLISEYHAMEEKEAAKRIKEEKKISSLILILCISAIIISAMAIYIFVRKYRMNRLRDRILADTLRTDLCKMTELLYTKDSEIESKNLRMDELSTAITDKNRETAELAGNIIKLTQHHINALNAIGTSGLQGKTAADYVEVLRLAKSRMSSLFKDPTIRQMLIAAADRGTGNVMKEFIKDFPGTSENVTVLFLCHVLGMAAPTIALVLDIDTDTVYRRKYKLRKKIEQSNSPLKETFLNFL